MNILWVVLYLYIFWTLFLGVAALYSAWRTTSVWVKILSFPLWMSLFVADVLWNYTGATILFLEFPAHGCWTFTEHLTWYLTESGWRKKIANVICKYLLNPYQIGGHCR